jgi:hypothetical protein
LGPIPFAQGAAREIYILTKQEGKLHTLAAALPQVRSGRNPAGSAPAQQVRGLAAVAPVGAALSAFVISAMTAIAISAGLTAPMSSPAGP